MDINKIIRNQFKQAIDEEWNIAKKTYKVDSLIVQFDEAIEYLADDNLKEKLLAYFEYAVKMLPPEDFAYLYNENIGR